jgi:hypothetical protein
MRKRTALAALGLLLLAVGGCTPARKAYAAPTEKPPVVRRAECRRATGAITVDGQLDEKSWQRAEPLRNFAVYWEKRPARGETTARLLWDDENLYFSADMKDEDLFALVKEHNGLTWEDDVFELFFKPAADRLPYYEFQVNALNTHLEMFLPSRGGGGYRRFAPHTRLGMVSVVRLRGTLNKWQDRDRGWSVEGRLPWSAFQATGGRPKAGASWRFALCRYDYSVTLSRPELSSTAPLTVPDFHRYEDYGELMFVGE